MSTYNTTLQSNNIDLQSILDTINELPDVGSGGATVETCSVEIVDDDWNRVYLAYQNATGENKIYDDLEMLGMVEIPSACTVKKGAWVILFHMGRAVTTSNCEVIYSYNGFAGRTMLLIHITGNTAVITLT